MGGTGTLLLSRWKPGRFSAATAFVPPHYTPETGSRLFGNTQTNLITTEKGRAESLLESMIFLIQRFVYLPKAATTA
jgi:hypothetical protein